MKSLLALILLVLLPSFPTLAWAEPEAIPGDQPAAVTAILDSMSPSSNEPLYTQQTQPSQQSSTAMDYRLRQEENRFRLIVMITLITPVILMILLHYVRSSPTFNDQSIVHTSGLVLVIQATTVVVLASTTTEQLSTAIGVLAAIAGYLFGSARNRKDSKPGEE